VDGSRSVGMLGASSSALERLRPMRSVANRSSLTAKRLRRTLSASFASFRSARSASASLKPIEIQPPNVPSSGACRPVRPGLASETGDCSGPDLGGLSTFQPQLGRGDHATSRQRRSESRFGSRGPNSAIDQGTGVAPWRRLRADVRTRFQSRGHRPGAARHCASSSARSPSARRSSSSVITARFAASLPVENISAM
jgi:hypothetical protein